MTPSIKTGQVCWAVGINGERYYYTVTLNKNEDVCPECEGQGTVHYDYGRDGFQSLVKETCKACNGSGRITLEIEEGPD